MQRQGGRNEVLRGRGERQEPTAGDRGQRGSRDQPQRASLPELSLVKSGRLASPPDLHVSCQPISQVRTLQLRWSAPRPRPHGRAGIGSLSGLGSRAKDRSCPCSKLLLQDPRSVLSPYPAQHTCQTAWHGVRVPIILRTAWRQRTVLFLYPPVEPSTRSANSRH